MRGLLRIALAMALPAAVAVGAAGQRPAPDIALFFDAINPDDRAASAALAEIAASWKHGYTPIFVDLLRAISPSPEPDGVGTRIRQRLSRFLEQQTRQPFADDVNAWRRWTWRQPYDPHPDYAVAKAEIYSHLDARMREFFPANVRASIRLDEIDWGGVAVNGIPPLNDPRVVPARQALYLKDDNVVFGLVINGEARAYPKRILAWHELARDRVGGVELTVVYCTLCGTVIPYDSVIGGTLRVLGTSGLLYRSNKLMFDEETRSLWSTLEGKPVVGPLVGSGLELKPMPIVTTTWGEWRTRHPGTTVLSEDTGHDRDYAEGAAYRDYFASDDLMFQVPQTDARLGNKAEVLAMLLTARDGSRRAVAIAADYLQRNRLYQGRFGDHSIVVLTSPDGANRVFDAGAVRFVSRVGDDRVRDADGLTWRADEEALVFEPRPTRMLRRLPARRAFWFGWYAQFPQTELVYR
jgi:hypothetical protein